MELGKTKRSRLIRRFLLNAVKAGDQQYIPDAVESFSVSRQTIHNHLTALVKMGYLEAHGNTRGRIYSLGSTRSHSAIFALEGLEESEVYCREFSAVFSELPETIEEICDYAFTEMLNNAIDHSEGTKVRISVERDQKTLSISIVDNGEGIFLRIARLLELSHPKESILELSKGKLTTDPQNHSGQGIFFTSRVCDFFLILSDELCFTHALGEDDILFEDQGFGQGTFVIMNIALNSKTTLKAVFDEFSGGEEDDYAFNKTIIPVDLARYEGERLVSRSQAKRILNRVEKFTRVCLDFKSVEVIGQAFADELFRVFPNKNPGIEITSINTTDAVSRKIRAASSNN